MKNSTKFLTLTLLILLAQSSLATKYQAGIGSVAHSEKTVAVGLDNKAGNSAEAAEEYNASAVGIRNEAIGRESSAFGAITYVSGEGSGAFGRGKYDYVVRDYVYKIEGNNSWAIGSFNEIAAGSDNNHILGNNVSIGTSSETIIDSVVLGNESTVEESQVVSVGSDTKRRKIVHLAAGTNDTDAVNKKQKKKDN